MGTRKLFGATNLSATAQHVVKGVAVTDKPAHVPVRWDKGATSNHRHASCPRKIAWAWCLAPIRMW